MFDRIAARYDLLNRVLSLGIDRRWRRRAVAQLQLAPGARALDLATGTGDVAIEMMRQQPGARVEALDPSRNMLDVAKHKLIKLDLQRSVGLGVADAEALPFAQGSFDGVAIAFGIRNVPDRARALREMARVTRPSGRVVILELTEPRGSWLAPLARLWVHRMVPSIGALLSGAREYRYLESSIAAFPPAEEFVAMMQSSGLRPLETISLCWGVATIFVATPATGHR
jgi:demethylmenaquinone methyltransferase/2-methoxy-6-polyprenyl-1,4-benzoquinol methylase